jgi:hypothetical protein
MATNPQLRGLTHSARTAAALARLTGWSLTANNKRTMLEMWNPSHEHKVIVPYGSVNAHRAGSILKQVIRYTPMKDMAAVVFGGEDLREDDDAAEVVATLGPILIETYLEAAETWADLPEELHRFIPPDHAVRRLPGGPDYERPVPEPDSELARELATITPEYTEVRMDNITSADVWARINTTNGTTEYLCKSHDEPRVFASLMAVTGHLKSHGANAKPSKRKAKPAGPGELVCPECGKGFTRAQGLGAHRRRTHGVLGESTSAENWRKLHGKDAEAPTLRQVRVVDPVTAEVDQANIMSGQAIAARIHGAPVARVHWAARETGKEGQPGKMYESAAVDLVTYADGHIGYVCQHCEAFASDNPRAVSAHAAQAHPGQSEQKGQPHFDVPQYEESGIRRSHRDTRLQHVITEALDTIQDWQAMTPTEVAVAITDYIADNRPERQPAEPLTDQEVLERIVRLVDRGQYASLQQSITDLSGQIADLSQRIDTDSDTINELEHDRDEALRRAEVLAAERTALREMLS